MSDEQMSKEVKACVTMGLIGLFLIVFGSIEIADHSSFWFFGPVPFVEYFAVGIGVFLVFISIKVLIDLLKEKKIKKGKKRKK